MDYTIDNNPFYNAVAGTVSKEIDTRASIYAARARGTKDTAYIHSWLHRKTAYVKVFYNGNPVLEPPKKGFESLYDNGLYPPAVVNSVRISNEGDFGSLLKADINFTVFTKSQLSEFTKSLLFVGSTQDLEPKPVTIEYGWTTGGDGGTERYDCADARRRSGVRLLRPPVPAVPGLFGNRAFVYCVLSTDQDPIARQGGAQ